LPSQSLSSPSHACSTVWYPAGAAQVPVAPFFAKLQTPLVDPV
jgi:hypothetical protein